MEKFFRQYDWALNIGLVAIGSVLAALLVNNFAASYLAPYTVPELPDFQATAKKPESPQTSQVPSNRDTTITKRCLVGCKEEKEEDPNVCAGDCGENEVCKEGTCVPKEPEKEEEEKPDVPVQSDLKYELLGTVVAGNPAYSQALVAEQNGRESKILSPGGYITEKAKIVKIDRNRILIERKDKDPLEFIRLNESMEGNPVPQVDLQYSTHETATQMVTQRKPKPSSSPDNPSSGTPDKTDDKDQLGGKAARQVDSNEWEVSKKAVERYLEKPEKLAEEGKLIPNYDRESKSRNGMKLSSPAPGSLYEKIGLQNGDVLLSINGEELENRRQAMDLVEELKKTSSVRLEIKRNNEKQTLKYNLK